MQPPIKLRLTLVFILFCLTPNWSQPVLENNPRLVSPISAPQHRVGPDEQFGALFEAVQLKAVFPDSKTFADCTPKFPPATILANYELARQHPDFNLKAFVLQHFALPIKPASGYTSKAGQSAQEHMVDLWTVLTRPASPTTKADELAGSLISLPKPYVVPGGRFGEIYYWDSYFTMLGLKAAGQTVHKWRIAEAVE